MQANQRLRSVCTVFALMLSASSAARATPLLALKEANNCAACHKPGRAQRPYFERRCTLDCQGCHIDPSGGGPRNQWGTYYTHTKVGVAALNFVEPQDPLQDTSRIDLHFDGRVIRRDTPTKTRVFPMSAEASVRIRPFVNYLHLTYQALFLGRTEDELFRMVREGDRQYREKYSVMIDQIPLNTYIRAYRGAPMYGIRRPNHTLWIRERIGLDQFATTDAVQIGTAPNVPYVHVSKMSGDPYVPTPYRQQGYSYHFGMRGVTLGWHLNTSGWSTESDYANVDMRAFGAGLNLFGIILYGERNVRTVAEKAAATEESEPPRGGPFGIPSRVHPSSVISEYTASFAVIRGIMAGVVLEELSSDASSSKRRSIFVDTHPVPNLQLEFWRRYETGARAQADSMAIAHLFVDF